MTQMVSVQIRFPPEELKRIDAYVARGDFHSRAEFIRDAVRKAELIMALNDLRKILEEEGLTEADLLEGREDIRQKVYMEMFGGKG